MSDTVKPVVQNSEQIDDLGTPLGAEEILLSKPERKKKRLDELRDFYKQRMPELREFYGEPDPQDILKEQENISSLDTTPELPVLTEEDTKEIARGIEMEEKIWRYSSRYFFTICCFFCFFWTFRCFRYCCFRRRICGKKTRGAETTASCYGSRSCWWYCRKCCFIWRYFFSC
jgi:hypothetical protein